MLDNTSQHDADAFNTSLRNIVDYLQIALSSNILEACHTVLHVANIAHSPICSANIL